MGREGKEGIRSTAMNIRRREKGARVMVKKPHKKYGGEDDFSLSENADELFLLGDEAREIAGKSETAEEAAEENTESMASGTEPEAFVLGPVIEDAAEKVTGAPKVPKAETAAEKMEKHKNSRIASKWTLERLEDPDNEVTKDMKYEDFNAGDVTEGDKKFLDAVRKIWNKFGVHGVYRGGKFVFDTDLDGKGSIELLRLAGFDEKALAKEALKYVEQGSAGDPEEGRVYADTGGIDGFAIKDKNLYGDHHAPGSPYGTASTKNYYKMLVDMGLLQKSEKLDRMVEFVTRMDNGDYPKIENYFKDSWKTVAGLERYMSREALVKFFLEDKNPDPTRELSEGELRKYGFIAEGKKDKRKNFNRSENQKNIAKKSQERLPQMEKEGLIVQSDRYGKIAISIESGNGDGERDLPGDFLAARAFGCDAYISWNPKENRFKISSKVPIVEKYPQGMGVRGVMWIKNNKDNAPLQVGLGEILTRMTDGKFVPEGKLKQYLEDPEAFLKKNSFEESLGKEIIEKVADRIRKFKEETLKNLEADETWRAYNEDTRNDILKVAIRETAAEILKIVIAKKKITAKIDEEKFFESILRKM